MNKCPSVIVLIGVFASVGSLAADELSYSYVQVSDVSHEIDDGPEGDGLELAAAVEIASQVHLFAGYEEVDLDRDSDATGWSAGLGYHRDLGESTSFFGEVGLVDVELDSNVGDTSDDGYSAAVGIRGLVGQKGNSSVELTGELAYVDLSDAGDDTQVSAGVLFNIGKWIGLGVAYTVADESDSLTAGVRFYWGG